MIDDIVYMTRYHRLG